MRKIVLATLVLALFASTALAWGGNGYGRGFHRGGMGGGCYFGGMGGFGGMRGFGMGAPRQDANGAIAPYTLPDGTQIPQEIIGKMEQMRALNADLRAAMYGGSVNKTQAKTLFKKQAALRDEISNWFFEQQLKQMGN